jgi:hypothetical protein
MAPACPLLALYGLVVTRWLLSHRILSHRICRRSFPCAHCQSLVCLLLAHKFTQDVPFKNIKWATWARVPVQWLNALEVAALMVCVCTRRTCCGFMQV